MNRRKVVPTIAAAAVVGGLALPLPAASAGPPIGKYQCYQYTVGLGYLYSGWFKLVSPKKYKVHNGETGRYRVKGKRLNFTSGPYKRYGWFGKYRRDSKGNPVIDVIAKDDPSLKQNCSLAKRG